MPCVTKIKYARPEGRGWNCGVKLGKEDFQGWLPSLSPRLNWTLEDGKVVGVEVGEFCAKATRKLGGSVGRGLALAVSLEGDVTVEEIMSRFAWPTTSEWGWKRVNGHKKLRWSSARKLPSPEDWPRVGGYVYPPHWNEQVLTVIGLLKPETIVMHAEPIYGKRAQPLVTADPVVHAELTAFGIPVCLVFPDHPRPSSPPSEVVVVGLEDTTLLNFIHMLEWLGPDVSMTIWHRFEARNRVPWRGEISPPMALEVATSICTRGPPGKLLGEAEPRVLDEETVRKKALATKMPYFVIGPERRRAIGVGSVVYDGELGIYGLVTDIKPGERPKGGLRSIKTVEAGLVYGGGCMMLKIECGGLCRTVCSDSPWLTNVTEIPKWRLPRLGTHVYTSCSDMAESPKNTKSVP